MSQQEITSNCSISIGVPELPRILRHTNRWRGVTNINDPQPQVNKKYENNDKGFALRVDDTPHMTRTPGDVSKPSIAPHTGDTRIPMMKNSEKPSAYMGPERNNPDITNVSNNKPGLLRKDVLR